MRTEICARPVGNDEHCHPNNNSPPRRPQFCSCFGSLLCSLRSSLYPPHSAACPPLPLPLPLSLLPLSSTIHPHPQPIQTIQSSSSPPPFFLFGPRLCCVPHVCLFCLLLLLLTSMD